MRGWGTDTGLGQNKLPTLAFNAQVDVCEKVYLGIFTFELLTKVLAYGFLWHPEAYLRDAWCQLDFVVVTLAWAPILFPTMGNYSVIRSFRALRPLRALKRMPGMPKLAGSACWKRRPGHSSRLSGPGDGGPALASGWHEDLGRSARAAQGPPTGGQAALVRLSARGPTSPTWRGP
jgi:hypothetical protein